MAAADGTLTIIARHLAATCALNDDYDRARTYAEQALNVAEKVRFRPEAALARLQLAELQLQLGNVQEARPLLDETTPELEAMRMRPDFERARALRSQAMATVR